MNRHSFYNFIVIFRLVSYLSKYCKKSVKTSILWLWLFKNMLIYSIGLYFSIDLYFIRI